MLLTENIARLHSAESFRSHKSNTQLKIPLNLWELKVHYRIHNSPPFGPILSQTNPVHAHYFFKIHIHITLPSKPGSSKKSLSPRYPQQNPSSPIRAKYPAHLILLDMITWITYGEVLTVQCPTVPTYLVPRSPKYTSVPSQTPSAYAPPSMWQTKFHTHTKQQAPVIFPIRTFWDSKGNNKRSSKHHPIYVALHLPYPDLCYSNTKQSLPPAPPRGTTAYDHSP